MKKYIILEAEHNGRKFKIEEDLPDVGAYLYVFEGEECTRDDLQDTIEICKQVAFKQFGVPLDIWKVVI